MNKKVIATSEFFGINESKCSSKKDIGLIGPLPDGNVKIRIDKSGKDLNWNATEEDDIFFEHGDYKINLPKKCVEVSSTPGYDVVLFKTGMNWFKVPENEKSFEDFLESYVSERYSKLSKGLHSLEEDVNLIIGEIGLDENVGEFQSDSDLEIQGSLKNGMEFELNKSTPEDLFKKFLIYKNQDEIHPSVELKRKGSKLSCKYRTPKGVFESDHDLLTSLSSNPIDKYLLMVCTGREPGDTQKDLVEHLFKLFRYHSWEKPETKSDSNMERYLDEVKEIKRVMEMLKNSIPEKHIEEMYTDARSKFSSSKK